MQSRKKKLDNGEWFQEQKKLSLVSSLSLWTSTSSSLSSPAADSLSLRHKGFLKDCPDGLLTEAGFIKIYTQVANHQPEKLFLKWEPLQCIGVEI